MKGKVNTESLHLFVGFFVLLAGLSLASCTKEDLPSRGTDLYDEAEIRLTVTAPGSSLPRTTNRSSVDMEFKISDIRILVFGESDGEYKFKYMVEGEQIQPDDSNPLRTNFTAKLKTSEDPIKLLLVANSEDSFASHHPALNENESDIRRRLTKEFTGADLNLIPMFGEMVLTSLDAVQTNNFQISMLRALARVDVVVDLDQGTSRNFVINEVFIYRSNDCMQVIPDSEAMSGSEILRVDSPSVPDGALQIQPYSKKVVSGIDDRIEKIYLPESLNYNDDRDKQLQAVCVVVGGYYNGENVLSYYRIDFNSGIAGHPFGQVLRNHRYEFTVRQVNGPGWETPDEAADNRSTTIIADIKTWEDFTMEMYANGDNYLGIASREVKLGYKAGLQKKIGVQSTVPYRISWVGGEEAVGIDDGPVSNDFFSARIESVASDPDDVTYIVITTLVTNNTVGNYHSQLKVEWSDWVFYVNITQLSYTAAEVRSIRVVSAHAGSTGSLGTTTNPQGANGRAMRMILSNPANFSPTGTVDFFSEFTFDIFPSESVLGLADGTNEYTYTARVLVGSADVIYLANDNNVSNYSARLIDEWLRSNPNKVLIMGADGDRTSTGFIHPKYNGIYMDQVDWYFNRLVVDNSYDRIQPIHSGDNNSNFHIVSDDVNTTEFYHGIFGDVPANTPFRCADTYFGYSKEIYNPDIIPLLKHEKAPEGSISLGIDKKRRIIYHGDASLHETGTDRLSASAHNSGTISSDQDRFFANMWAWIARQVIYGDEMEELCPGNISLVK
ncbi:MAG: FimB/Mfa2 family fimbrial subunit [Rikenellaceae bacterium]|nr:FimB/Mfa2 family fimbrial subunit [Rikenellaceae bacterium]